MKIRGFESTKEDNDDVNDPAREDISHDAGLEQDGAASAALKLLIEETQKASKENDRERFDQLILRLLEVGGSPPRDAGSEVPEDKERQPRNAKDVWRIRVAVILIFGLIASVFFAVVVASGSGPKGADGETIAQYLSLVSGLAGIALGWLYGDRSSSA